MNRELKFRAFDGQRMIHFSNLMIGIGKGYVESSTEAIRDKEPYVYFTEDTFNGEVRLGKHEIMQYTGLKDKNGKDVFNDDVLEHSIDKRLLNWKVEWVDAFAGFGIVNIGVDGYLGDRFPVSSVYYFQDREVIGNIYENPELLGKENNKMTDVKTIETDWTFTNYMMPPDSKNHGSYSETVEFATKRGHVFIGWFRYDFNEWIVKNQRICFSRNDVVRWRLTGKEKQS